MKTINSLHIFLKNFYGRDRQKKIILTLVIIILLAAAVTLNLLANRKYSAEKNTDLQTAYNLSGQGKTDQAIKILEKRWEFDKSGTEVAKQLAIYYFQDKKYDEFLKLTEKSKLEDAQIYTMLAFIARSYGDQQKTIGYYEKAIKLKPHSTNGYVDLANYYQILGQIDKSLATIKEGLNYSPKSSTLNLLAANYSITLGDKVGAKSYATKVLEVDKDNSRAQAILSLK